MKRTTAQVQVNSKNANIGKSTNTGLRIIKVETSKVVAFTMSDDAGDMQVTYENGETINLQKRVNILPYGLQRI